MPQIENPHKTWIEIDKENLISNLRAITAKISPLKVMAVVKADAYGMGDRLVPKILAEAGTHAFGVTEIDAALAIKVHGRPVQLLGGITPDEIPAIVREDIIAPINSIDDARKVSAEAVKQKKIAVCHIKIDTGMGRIGILDRDALEAVLKIMELPGLDIQGIYSHFPHADEAPEYSDTQVKKFKALLSALSQKNITFSSIHIANSDGVKYISEAIQAPFTMVRTGIALYGPKSIKQADRIDLLPALKIKSRLVAVRDLPAGASIGYNRTYQLPKVTKVGTVAIGYADGLPIGIQDKGYFIINGNKCPVIGRVSMNLTTISLENAKDANPGDVVTCIGDGIWIDEWARYKHSIAYDVLCSLGSGVEKRLI